MSNRLFLNSSELAQDAVGGIFVDSTSIDFTYADATPSITAVVLPAGVDHNSLANLTVGDTHTQYALLAGRATPQQFAFGTASGAATGYLTSTVHATKGKYFLNAAGTITIDEVGVRLGIGSSAPIASVDLASGTIAITDSDVAHGMTDILPTNALFYVSQETAASGGAAFYGVSTNSAVVQGLKFFGILAEADPVDTTAAIRFDGLKKNGTSWQALGADETVAEWSSHINTFLRLKGDGRLVLVQSGGYLDLSAISAGNPNLKITATSDTPAGTPSGYMEVLVGSTPKYIQLYT